MECPGCLLKGGELGWGEKGRSQSQAKLGIPSELPDKSKTLLICVPYPCNLAPSFAQLPSFNPAASGCDTKIDGTSHAGPFV